MHGAFVTHKHKLVLVWFGVPAGPGVEPRHSATVESVCNSTYIYASVMLIRNNDVQTA